MTNQDYKNAALAALKGKWAPAVLAAIIYTLLIIPYFCIAELPLFAQAGGFTLPSWFKFLLLGGVAYMWLFFYPLANGYVVAHRELLVKGDDRLTGNMFHLTFSHWLRFFGGYLLMVVKILLWMFVLIIPGFVKAFAYALTPFLLVDCPDLTPLQCIKLSDRMMKGHKFDLFYLFLSFLGWLLLGLLTLGIGYFWLMPYMETSVAAFYEDVKAQYRAGLETANDLTN